MTFTKTLLATVAALAVSAPLYAADLDSSDTNAHTSTSAGVSAATPTTGVNVGANAIGKNTVKSGNSKGARAARGYDQTEKQGEGNVHAGANADAGVKGTHEDR